MVRWGLGAAVLAVVLAACGDDGGSAADAGGADAGRSDAGQPEAGQPEAGAADAGQPDAGQDGGPVDAGVDAGAADAGMDAGAADAGMDAGAADAGGDAGPADAGVDAGSADASVAACAPVVSRVTNDGAGSTDPSMVWNGSGYGVAWAETRDGNSEVYFARLDASGSVLGSEVRVTDDAATSEGVSVVWTGTEYGLVWYDQRPGTYQVYFARLDDTGAKIGSDVRVTTDPARSWGPAMVWNGSGFGVAWWDVRDGNDEVYFARLDATGAKVGSDVRVTNGADAGGPAIVWTGTEYGLAWGDRRDGAGAEIYFARLDDTGAKIGGDVRVTTTSSGSSGLPSLVWNGTEYALGWEDSRSGTQELYFVRLDATGAKIGSDTAITTRLFSPWNMAWDGTGYGLAWSDNRDGNLEIYFTRLDATGARVLPDVRITDDPEISRATSLAWTGSGWGLAWTDLEYGNWEILFADPCP